MRRRPSGIGAGGQSIWVTSYINHTVTRVDPRTGRPTGVPVPVPLNPYVVAVTPDSVWLAAVARGQVARVRYAAPR